MVDSNPKHIVSIDWSDVVNPLVNFRDSIELAYGPEGLGICTIYNVPGFADLRRQLLPYASLFAGLPNEVKCQCEDVASFYSFGYSHGKEALINGRPDVAKGSYYNNPLTDCPTTDASLQSAYPTYFRPNVWPPPGVLPEFRRCFMELGKLMIDVGLAWTKHLDRYLQCQSSNIPQSFLENIIRSSSIHKARLLHYEGQAQANNLDNWCGWHFDHGSLTALVSAIFMEEGNIVANPDPDAGLYVEDRLGHCLKVVIPEDHIAFQVGEAMQIHSGGLLRATKHGVRAISGVGGASISRNTFAVFMQPDVHVKMQPPFEVPISSVAVGQWTPGQTFGEFSNNTVRKYYQ